MREPLTLRANNRMEVHALASMLRFAPAWQKPLLAAFVSHGCLMLPTQRAVRFAFWLLRVRRGDVFKRFVGYFTRLPDIASEIVQQTADHAVHGRDTEDADSVGGFSQREMDAITGFIHIMNEATR